MRASAYRGITESGRNRPTKRNVYTAEWPRTRRRAIGKAISRPSTTESAAAATEYSTVFSSSTPRSAPFHAPLKLLVTGEPGVSGEDRKWDGDSNASMIAYRTGSRNSSVISTPTATPDTRRGRLILITRVASVHGGAAGP